MRLSAAGLQRFFGAVLFTLILPAGLAQASETVRINGSGTGLEVMKPLIKAYLRSKPGVSIQMEKPLGSSGAIKALMAGALDIAVSSKPLKSEEAAHGLQLRLFGKTPLAIVVGEQVPVVDITTAELEAIYSGRTLTWTNLGKIRIVLRPLEDIDTKILRSLSPGMSEAITMAQNRRGMFTAVTDPESNEAVARMPGSLGTSGLAGILVEKSPLRVLTLNGVMPSRESLKDGRYPLAKEIHIVTSGRPSGPVLEFLAFIYSDEGRVLVEKVGVLLTVDIK